MFLKDYFRKFKSWENFNCQNTTEPFKVSSKKIYNKKGEKNSKKNQIQLK